MNLTRDQIRRLFDYQRTHSLDLLGLKLAMDTKLFKLATLKAAMAGKSLRPATYRFLSDWIAEHCGGDLPVVDGKSAAAGERS